MSVSEPDGIHIKNLKTLLASKLENGDQIVNTQITRLTAPGENYGSIMLRILVNVENELSKEKRILDLVGKILPEDKRTRDVFNIQVTYKNEYAFYAVIVPTLNAFIKSRNVAEELNMVAPFVAGRLNLNGSNVIDEDGIMIMENLHCKGYKTGTKTIGLSVDESKFVLKSLAELHATGLALRLLKPRTFSDKVAAFFYHFKPEKELLQMIELNVVHTLEKKNVEKETIDLIKKIMNQDFVKKGISDIWGTITQCDAWTANLLLKYEKEKPTHCIMVDYQVCNYGTPLIDVMFFFFSSLLFEDFNQKNIDDLLQFYYETFLNNLKKFDLDTRKYTKESFESEIKFAVKNYEFCHTMWMLHPLLHEEFTSVDSWDKKDVDVIVNWSDRHVERIIRILDLCVKKGWLYD